MEDGSELCKLAKLGMISIMKKFRKLTERMVKEIMSSPIYPMVTIIMDYVNGFCGYLNSEKILDKITKNNQEYNAVSPLYSWSVKIIHYDCFNFDYQGTMVEVRLVDPNIIDYLPLTLSSFWSSFIIFDPYESSMTIDVMEDIIFRNFGYQNVSKLAWLGFLKIRDNIIGDCIDPWLVTR